MSWIDPRTGLPEVDQYGEPGAFINRALITLGKEAAEYVSAFPPIWTEIEMTVYANGEWTHQLIQHSLFPSVSYYAINEFGLFERQGKSYDAVSNLERWKNDGWGPVLPGKGGPTAGKPSSMTSPKGWGGSATKNVPASNGTSGP
ncbi:MAG TPA: hypothetical protein VGP07_02520 [Polyangia bacterium]|jgi:hypothetical protein